MSGSKTNIPTIDELVEVIKEAGSGETFFFGYEKRSDGLYLQQDPPEFAAFVHYMATQAPPSALSIDIGVASGGQTKFLRDFYRCERTIIVDLGQHPDAAQWPRIKTSVNSEIVLELIDDSHSAGVRQRLLPFRRQVDFAFVDGDHSYRGLRQDIFLVRELLRPGALMALHDTLAVPECKAVHDELLRSSIFEHVQDFNSKFGISLWRLKEAAASNVINRRFGFGRM